MEKVRWGILSTAKIGVAKFIPGFQRSNHCEVTAIASRSWEKAAAAAGKLGIPKAYGSYEELLADPEIDAVYNPLPNHLHVPWSIRALEAGKHVLCEKPLALTSGEAQRLLDAAQARPGLKVMEAFMYRFHPQWQMARQAVANGHLGKLQTIHSFFSYYNTDANNIRNMAEIGGGGLMDIGCYPISLSRFIFDAEPVRVVGVMDFDPQFGTDRLGSGMLQFEKGTSTFTYGTQLAPYQRVHLFGSEGRLEIEIPFNAPPDLPARIWIQDKGETKEIQVETCDQYAGQGDQFSLAILRDTEAPVPLADGVANMKVIEAMFESAKNGNWVAVKP